MPRSWNSSQDKKPIEVSIELDFDPKEVEKVYFDYLRLKGSSNLTKIYQELGNHVQNLVKFYWSFREVGVDNKIITHILDIANDIPDLERKIKDLQDERKELEVQIQKKNKDLKYLNGQIEKATYIFYDENAKSNDLSRHITCKKIDLEDLKKLRI